MIEHTQRLFPGFESLPAELAAAPQHPGWDFAIGRLLEDGDGRDLRWLAAHRTTEQLSAWLERHGARSLSRRSRLFWAVLLLATPAPSATRNPLWPLG